jgi:15-cis-phytoene synthase
LTPDQYCEEKAARSGSSFYYSFLFLPHDKRRAIVALYAFCREVDDVVDECSDPGVASAKLAWWRGEIGSAFGGEPQHPVSRALAPAVARFKLPLAQFHEIIDGMEMDLAQNRYPDFESLRLYCHRVAGVVGLLSAEIFGYRDRGTLDYAHELGLAFQLTNVVRDVGEDARRGRIYLPIDELERFGTTPTDILQRRKTDGFVELMKFQIARARDCYVRAFELLPPADRTSQRPGLMMAAIYRTLLDEIERDGCQVLTQRVSLTPLRKFWIASKAWISA